MFDKIAVTRILIFPCRLTIISSEIFAYLEISLMVILVIFICLFDTSMQNGGKKMEEDCYFMIFVQSRLNYLSDDEKNWTNCGEISLFVKSFFFCFVVECINKFVCCFFVSKKNEKRLLFYDYYLTFDSFDFRSICTNDGKRLKTNRG